MYGDDFEALASNSFELPARSTLPVGIFPEGPSPAGIDDLSRNVFEWTASAPEPYPHDRNARSSDALSDARVCRWRFVAPPAQQGSGGVPRARTVLRTL